MTPAADHIVNLTTHKLETPLSLSLMTSNAPELSLIQLLLSHGASTSSILSSGKTVLHDVLSNPILSLEQRDVACFLHDRVYADNVKTLDGEFLAKLVREGSI